MGVSDHDRQKLIDALGDAQRIGMLGAADVAVGIDQALAMADLIPDDATDYVDLGSGGGLPGLVIAVARPDLTGLLVDRRGKRTDLLARLVGRLGLVGRLVALEADVADLPVLYPHRTWSVVTSRGFGSPEYTARLAAPLVADHGWVLVTEPPGSTGERWKTEAVGESGLELVDVRHGIARLRLRPR